MDHLASSGTAQRSDSVSGAPLISSGAFVRSVLITTALVGTLDIIAAHLHIWAASGNFPTRVFKGIAGGALGRQAVMEGGAAIVFLGIFFHYFISLTFTLFFFLAYPRMAALRKNIWASGIGYALFVWLVMNFVVLPLSALHAPLPDFANKHTYFGACVLAVVFGVPIALCAERFYRNGRRA